MRTPSLLLAALAALAMAAADADAARRFGGGGNLGKQRPAPTQREATPAQPASPPAQQAAPSAAPAQSAAAKPGAAPAAQPSFMSRFGGLIAGLGLGALVGALFGGLLGPVAGTLVLFLLLAILGFVVWRLVAARRGGASTAARSPVEGGQRPAFAGIGSALPGGSAPEERPMGAGAAAAPPAPPSIAIPGFQVEPFVRVAKTSFIRLQAANDAGDLDDIRDYTTPEMFAELSMQVRDRKEPQRTEVVSVDARVIEAVVEGDYEIASVRFTGLMREQPGANPEPFDEVWHVRKSAKDPKGAWLIAGIQQVE